MMYLDMLLLLAPCVFGRLGNLLVPTNSSLTQRRVANARDIPPSKAQFESYMLEYHSTRYGGGCWGWLGETKLPLHYTFNFTYNYSLIHPFVFNFDYLVTLCGVKWDMPNEVGDRSPCLFRVPRQVEITHIFKDDGYTRIHVFGDRDFIAFFRSSVLPQFPTEKLIVHVGTGDRSMSLPEGKFLVEHPQIVRLVVENCRDPQVANNPKTVLQPVGICTRENHGILGNELRQELSIVEDDERSRHRLLKALSKNATRWAQRSNKILVCFQGGEGRPSRNALIEWAAYNCSQCILCNSTHPLTHKELWSLYTKHRYIVSPHGNGVDCGRTWEILILGAVPLIEFFAGARGYLDADIKAILFRLPSELNEENITRWNSEFSSGTETRKLTRDFWNNQSFATPHSPP